MHGPIGEGGACTGFTPVAATASWCYRLSGGGVCTLCYPDAILWALYCPTGYLPLVHLPLVHLVYDHNA